MRCVPYVSCLVSCVVSVAVSTSVTLSVAVCVRPRPPKLCINACMRVLRLKFVWRALLTIRQFDRARGCSSVSLFSILVIGMFHPFACQSPCRIGLVFRVAAAPYLSAFEEALLRNLVVISHCKALSKCIMALDVVCFGNASWRNVQFV